MVVDAAAPVHAIAIVTPAGAAKGTLYESYDVVRSADGGATWEARGGGPRLMGPYGLAELLAVGPTDGAVYARGAAPPAPPGAPPAPAVTSGALLRSTDGGWSVQEVGAARFLRQGVRRFAVSPANGRQLAAIDAQGVLLGSSDGGATWRRLRPAGDVVRDVAWDARDGKLIYAVRRRRGASVLLASRDLGVHWQRVARRAAGMRLLAHPARAGLLMASAGAELLVLRNGGAELAVRRPGFGPAGERDAFPGAFVGNRLVVAGRSPGADGGLYASVDLGRTWRRVPESLPAAEIGAVVAGGSGLLVVRQVAGDPGRTVWRVPAPVARRHR